MDKIFTKAFFITISVALLITSAPAFSGGPKKTKATYRFHIQAKGCCTLVAHAGGAVDGNPYTNSQEALTLSIATGFRLIEIDFSRIEDGHWFTTHDWKYWAARTNYKGTLPPTASHVRRLKSHFRPTPSVYGIPGTYSTMSLGELTEILAKHPNVKIVTDTKSSEAALALIHSLKGTRTFHQFIFQIYGIDDLKAAAKLVPDRQLILTTYQLRDWWAWDGFDKVFLAKLKHYPNLFALTVPMSVASDHAKMHRIKQAVSIPILVHGESSEINSHNLHEQLANWGVNGVYID